MTTPLTTETPLLHGQYAVRVDGKQYDVHFHEGRPERVTVTYRTESTYRYPSGKRQSRWVWGMDYHRREEPKPGSVPAKLVAMVREPAVAAKAGAVVETPAQRAERWRRMDDRLAAEARMQAQTAKLAEAAPALLAALKALLETAQALEGSLDYAELHLRPWEDRPEPPTSFAQARAAIAQAEGEG